MMCTVHFMIIIVTQIVWINYQVLCDLNVIVSSYNSLSEIILSIYYIYTLLHYLTNGWI